MSSEVINPLLSELGVTTFREDLTDGSEKHSSLPGNPVIEIGGEVLQQVLEVGVRYEAGLDPSAMLGMGLRIDSVDQLNNLPRLNYSDSRQPNAILHPVFDAFGRFIYDNRDEALHGISPTYIRVLGIGPEAGKEQVWHCDHELGWDEEGRYITSQVNLTTRRLVVGVDTALRDDRRSNLQFVDGSFVVADTESYPTQARTADAFSNAPNTGKTLVHEQSRSVGRISSEGYSPPEENIRVLDNNVLTDVGCVTLHAANPISDTMRLSLQCFYGGDS